MHINTPMHGLSRVFSSVWHILFLIIIFASYGCQSKVETVKQSEQLKDLPDSLNFTSDEDKWDNLYKDTLETLQRMQKSQKSSLTKKANADVALELLNKGNLNKCSNPWLIESNLKPTLKPANFGKYGLMVFAFNMNRELDNIIIYGKINDDKKIKVIYKTNTKWKYSSMMERHVLTGNLVSIDKILESEHVTDTGDTFIIEYKTIHQPISIPDIPNLVIGVTDRQKGPSNCIEIERYDDNYQPIKK